MLVAYALGYAACQTGKSSSGPRLELARSLRKAYKRASSARERRSRPEVRAPWISQPFCAMRLRAQGLPLIALSWAKALGQIEPASPSCFSHALCLWSHWQDGAESLDSFAAITDEPPPEISAAGHDRVIISLKSENIDAWQAQYEILQDPLRPYYEHRMAA